MKITIKNQEFDLSPEEIEALKDTLDYELPETYNKCVEILRPDWLFRNTIESVYDKYWTFFQQLATEKHAKSVLAMCQLMTIAEALNRTCEKIDACIEVAFDLKSRMLFCGTYAATHSCPIQFNSKELATHAIKHFESLWYDYFMIEP